MAETPAWFFTKALSHRQKVLRLYRCGLREIDSWFPHEPLERRFHKVLLRSRFDEYKNEVDSRKAKILLIDGIKELWSKRSTQPFIHFGSPPSFAAGRQPDFQEQILDMEWFHQDRYMYPYYFARRDQRKKEVLEAWEKIEASWKKPFDKKKSV